jgi:hypothetical protein
LEDASGRYHGLLSFQRTWDRAGGFEEMVMTQLGNYGHNKHTFSKMVRMAKGDSQLDVIVLRPVPPSTPLGPDQVNEF